MFAGDTPRIVPAVRPPAVVLAASLVAATLAPTPARADRLDEVRRLEAALEFEQALAAVERIIASGTATPPGNPGSSDDLAALHFWAGRLAAGLDRPAVAQDHFARALALESVFAVGLDPGTSPKVTAPFEAARASARLLHVTSERHGAIVTISTDGDPLHLVAAGKARFVDGSGHHQERTASAGPPFTIALPADAHSIEIVATDEYGNVVYVAAEPATTPRVEHAPWYGNWKLWAGATAFAGGVAGLCAWRESVAQDDWNQLRATPHDYSALRAVEDRGRAWALAANITVGVAGAAAIASTVAFFTHRESPPVTITAGPGTVGIAGRF